MRRRDFLRSLAAGAAALVAPAVLAGEAARRLDIVSRTLDINGKAAKNQPVRTITLEKFEKLFRKINLLSQAEMAEKSYLRADVSRTTKSRSNRDRIPRKRKLGRLGIVSRKS